VFKHFSTYRTTLIPQFGYHVEVKIKNFRKFETEILEKNNYGQICEELKQNGWTLCFNNKENNKIYFRTFQTDVLNSEMGDIISEISVIENEILFEIQTLLTEKYSKKLIKITNDINNLDALFSLATAAINHGLHKPKIKSDSQPYVSFKNGGFQILNDFNSSNESDYKLDEIRSV